MFEQNPSKASLIQQMSEVLSDVVTYKFQAHGYHWNVKGPFFSQFHEFFEDLYNDADGSIDPLAEIIRKLGADSPFTLDDFSSLTCISPLPVAGGDPIAMATELLKSNQHIKAHLTVAYDIANLLDEQGVCNFLAERIDVHSKWIWQLSTTVGADHLPQVNVVVTSKDYDNDGDDDSNPWTNPDQIADDAGSLY
jgi:starvation-inducible DNA-binding protein